MSLDGVAWAKDMKPETTGQKLVLMLLADYHNDKHDRCDPSVNTIAERAVMTERSVRRILIQLEEQGFLKREDRAGRCNLYLLNFSIRWPDPRALQPASARKRADASVSPLQPLSPDTQVSPLRSPTPDTSVTPDNMSPLTPETATPDTSVRGGMTPASAEQAFNSQEQEEVPRGRAEPPPPPVDVPRNWQPLDNDLVTGIREAWVEQWTKTTADTPILTSQTILALQSAIAKIERDNPELQPRTVDYWQALFRHLAKSDFLAGRKLQADGRPFRMRLHWLLREDNLAKCRAHEYCEPHHCGHVRPAAQVSR